MNFEVAQLAPAGDIYLCVCIYIYVCVCVCVCMRVRVRVRVRVRAIFHSINKLLLQILTK